MQRSTGSTIDRGVFGIAFAISAVFVLWGVFFTDNLAAVASAGLGAAFLLIAVGQILGALIAGVVAGAVGLPPTFWAFAGVAVLTALIRPRTEQPLAA